MTAGPDASSDVDAETIQVIFTPQGGGQAADPVTHSLAVLKVDLDGDFNHDRDVDGDDPDDPDEHTAPGLLVPLNVDDDDLSGTADKDEVGPIVDGDGIGHVRRR